MADTIELNAGAGGAILATDDILGVHYQRIKVTWGADGTATDVSAAAPLPVVQTGTHTVTGAGGTFPATDSGGSLTVDNATLDTVGGGLEATAQRVTIASDSTGVLSVDDNGGSLTVDGTVAATQSGAWSITDISGTVSLPTGAATAAKQPALGTAGTPSADVISVQGVSGGTALPTSTVDTTASGSITSNQSVTISTSGQATVGIQVAGSFTGTLMVEGSIDGGTTWNPTTAVQLSNGTIVSSVTGPTAAQANTAGLSGLRIRGNTVTVGTATVALRACTTGPASVMLDNPLPVGTNNIGDVDILTIAAGDNNIGNVDIVTMPNVTLAAGTNTNEVVGDAAHDAAIAGNPVRIGARALSADFTAVATGDTTDIVASLLGKQVVLPYALPGSTWNYAAASGGIVNTTGVSARAAAGAGIRNYITHVDVVNGHATVSTDVQIRDGAAGTVLWRGFAQAAGGGVSAEFNPPLRGTANTLVEIACGTTGTATYFNLCGYSASE